MPSADRQPVPSFDPEALEVLGIDVHLPTVAAERLASTSLRQRFLTPPVWRPEIVGEARLHARTSAAASVLIGLVQRDELCVLLTQRAADLRDHPGQIAFPGGRAEAFDADATATALREAHEEIGLARVHVDVLGRLPEYTTGTGFVVTPIVALVDPRYEPLIDAQEVAEVFEVPLSFLMNPAHHRHHAVELAGARREFLSMPWTGAQGAQSPRRYFIWGATAAMLRNFYRFLAA